MVLYHFSRRKLLAVKRLILTRGYFVSKSTILRRSGMRTRGNRGTEGSWEMALHASEMGTKMKKGTAVPFCSVSRGYCARGAKNFVRKMVQDTAIWRKMVQGAR